MNKSIKSLIEAIKYAIKNPGETIEEMDDYWLPIYYSIESWLRQASGTYQLIKGHKGRAPIEIQMLSEDITKSIMDEDVAQIETLVDPSGKYITSIVSVFTKAISNLINDGKAGKLKVLPNVVCAICHEEENMENSAVQHGNDLTEVELALHNLDIYTVDSGNNIICNECLRNMDFYEITKKFHILLRDRSFDYESIIERIAELSKTMSEEEILDRLK